MTKKLEIHSTVTRGVKAPRLKELKERECSLPELQAALVQRMASHDMTPNV